jgi:hypothetical protein
MNLYSTLNPYSAPTIRNPDPEPETCPGSADDVAPAPTGEAGCTKSVLSISPPRYPHPRQYVYLHSIYLIYRHATPPIL